LCVMWQQRRCSSCSTCSCPAGSGQPGCSAPSRLVRVIGRTTRMLVSRGLLEEPDPEDALAHLQAQSLQTGLPWRLANQRSSAASPWSSTGTPSRPGRTCTSTTGWGCSICVGMGCGPRSLKSGWRNDDGRVAPAPGHRSKADASRPGNGPGSTSREEGPDEPHAVGSSPQARVRARRAHLPQVRRPGSPSSDCRSPRPTTRHRRSRSTSGLRSTASTRATPTDRSRQLLASPVPGGPRTGVTFSPFLASVNRSRRGP
jgi:hypothetical protein